MPDKPEIRIALSRDEWARDAATLVQELGTYAVHDHGRFFIALSGGTTPELLYKTLASPPYAGRFDWSRTTFFFSDERCVPPDHPDSNFGLADRALFTPLGIPPARICRMKGETKDPPAAALDYEQCLRTTDNSAKKNWPRLDLVLLGLGQDGHTASLFPGTNALREVQRRVTVGQSPSGIPTRLTLTLGVINQASVVLFLVTGAGKATILKRVLEPETDADRMLPATLVRPENGRLIWLLDSPAAALIEG